MRVHHRWFALCTTLLLIGVALWFWQADQNSSENPQITNRPFVALANGFIGSASCQECHPGEHQSWHTSYHRTMTQTISADTAPTAIENTSVELDGHVYLFEKNSAGEYSVELDDPTLQGMRVKRPLVLMTGSHHMHVFWYESDFDFAPALLPILYLIKENKWIPRHSAFLRPPDFPSGIELGRWNTSCSNCHATHTRHPLLDGTNIRSTQVVEFGISCEECHGPAEEHVRYHREATASTDDLSMVNPQHLPAETRSDLCGHCHGVTVSNWDVVSVDDFLRDGCGFRPGNSLLEHGELELVTANPKVARTKALQLFVEDDVDIASYFWPDGEVRVSGREFNGLVESPCFKNGDLSCISCHQLHEKDVSRQDEWKDDQLKVHMRGNQACIQCHDTAKDYGPAHTHHAVGSSGSECMNCHMPHTVYGLLKTIRSHRITSPSVSTTLATGRPNACNLCHLDQSLEWTARHLNQWHGHPVPDLVDEQTATSAAVLHLLKGDAAQRAIAVSAFAWKPAQQVSGTEWMPPLLLIGMEDPYDAIRLISYRSLRTLPQWSDFTFDPVASREDRIQITGPAIRDLKKNMRSTPRSSVLFNSDGSFDAVQASRLLLSRDHREIDLQE